MMKWIYSARRILLIIARPLIAGLAKGRGEEACPEVLVVNKGVGGYNTADGLKQFDYNITEVKPDYLVLYFGLNDALNSHKLIDPATYRINMQQMIDRAKQIGVRMTVLVTPNPIVLEDVVARHPTHPAKDDLSKHLDQFVQIVRELATQNSLPMVDLHQLITEKGIKKLVRHRGNNRNFPDGVHLNPAGYKVFAESVAELFKECIKPGDVVVCLGDSVTYGAGMVGQGTIFGQTYPAWLSMYLNHMAGVRDLASPPAPPQT